MKKLDKGEEGGQGEEGGTGALLLDLSKAFGSLQHDLSLVNLNEYGFNYKSIKLISFFLFERRCITKI